MTARHVFAGILLLSAAAAAHALDLTVETLSAGRWGPEHGQFGVYLSFRPDGTFVARSNGEGGGPTEGTYAISGGSVMLSTYGCRTYTLVRDDTSLYATEALTCAKGSTSRPAFWTLDAQVPDGQPRVIDGVRAVTVSRTAQCTANVSIRGRPSTSAERYQYVGSVVGADGVERAGTYASLPSGKTVRILARTPGEETINGLTAPWYYVSVALGWEESIKGSTSGDEGWVFGGYLS